MNDSIKQANKNIKSFLEKNLNRNNFGIVFVENTSPFSIISQIIRLHAKLYQLFILKKFSSTPLINHLGHWYFSNKQFYIADITPDKGFFIQPLSELICDSIQNCFRGNIYIIEINQKLDFKKNEIFNEEHRNTKYNVFLAIKAGFSSLRRKNLGNPESNPPQFFWNLPYKMDKMIHFSFLKKSMSVTILKSPVVNPDLAARIKEGKELNKYNRATFYGGQEKGYTDYPSL